MTIQWEDYTPLVEAAEQMGLAYSTAHQYCKQDLLPGAILFRGTRWFIADATIKAFNNGEINIKGAFRKGDRGEGS
jgi:hypothetical protein